MNFKCLVSLPGAVMLSGIVTGNDTAHFARPSASSQAVP